MKLAIMQPYLFPYIGYFQLISAVDKFVIYNDVNFINKGWINRNRILVNGKDYLFRVNLSGASQNKLINEITVLNELRNTEVFLETIKHSYSKAPYYNVIVELIKKILSIKEERLDKFIANSLFEITAYLGIKTELIFSSDLKKNNNLRGQDKILEICKLLKASEYLNPIGGTDIYNKEKFRENGIKLYFLKTKAIAYEQFKNEFVPNLSIIDVLMFNSKEDVKGFLNEYELI